MIRLEPLRGGQLARVYAGAADPGPMAPFVATFVIEWDEADARALWIKGLNGKMTRGSLRELLVLLVDLGVRTVLAKRADGHKAVHTTKALAVHAGVRAARYHHDSGGLAQLVIRLKNGRIQEERTYGKDPRRTPG